MESGQESRLSCWLLPWLFRTRQYLPLITSGDRVVRPSLPQWDVWWQRSKRTGRLTEMAGAKESKVFFNFLPVWSGGERVCLGLSGSVWVCLGLSGSVGVCLGLSGSVGVCLGGVSKKPHSCFGLRQGCCWPSFPSNPNHVPVKNSVVIGVFGHLQLSW